MTSLSNLKGFLVLIEYALLSFGVYYAYSVDIKPPAKKYSRASNLSGLISDGGGIHADLASAREGGGGGDNEDAHHDSFNLSGSYNASHGALIHTPSREDDNKSNITFCQYVAAVFRFHDLFYNLTPSDPDALTTPLTNQTYNSSSKASPQRPVVFK